MPIGSSKLGVLGAGLVPGGTETFNAPGTFSIPPGVKKVSITGKGGTGNPGVAGNPGNPGNPGNGAPGGMGGTGINEPGTTITATGAGFAFKSGVTALSTLVNNAIGPMSLACASNPIVTGCSGQTGQAGQAGNAGSTGNPGQCSSGLGNNFAGGAGGNAGVAGNAGAAGTGGTAGSPGTPGPGGAAGGSGGNAGGSGGAGFGNPGSWCNRSNQNGINANNFVAPGPQLFCPIIAQISGGSGGGGAGVTNSGSSGANARNRVNDLPFPAPSDSLSTPLVGPGGTDVNVSGSTGNYPVGFQAINAANVMGGTGGSLFAPFGAGLTSLVMARTDYPCNLINGPIPGPSYPPRSIPGRINACMNFALTPVQPGGLPQSTNFIYRSGGGGGRGAAFSCSKFAVRNPDIFNAINNAKTGGGGGGGGRGNVGNAGGNSSTPSGSVANPTTFNCVPVTPGGTAPITVASPGGQIVISWNPQ